MSSASIYAAVRSTALRFRNLFGKQKVDRQLSDELESHLQLHMDDNLRSGMSPSEARRNALLKLGGVQSTTEAVRDSRSLPAIESFFQDLQFGVRILFKNPVFALTAILTLALGIGATTAIFSVIDGVLLRPLPYKDPGQIVRLWEQNAEGGRMDFADLNFDDLRDQNHSFHSLAEYGANIVSVSGRGDAARIATATVSSDFFSVMQVQPVLGRLFVPEEQRLNAAISVLVSYGYWQQYLGAQPDLAPIRLKIGGQSATVVGVLPPGFRFPENSDIWQPREIFERYPSRSAHNWHVIARLNPGVRIDQARTELSLIAARLEQQFGQETMMSAVAVQSLRDSLTGNVRPVLILLFVASAFLLLIACANVFNLMLAQSASREKELSIRTSLGAGRGRLARQFLAESFLLSAIGGAAGILLAWFALGGLLSLAPPDIPRIEEVSLNGYVLLFSFAVVFLVSVGLGLFTALRAVGMQSRGDFRSESRGLTGSPQKQKLRRALSAAQIAVALVLLVGASLLGKSLLRVLSVNPGFRTDGVVAMEIDLPDNLELPQRVTFLTELFSRLRTLPGVQAIGGTNVLPLAGPYFPNGTFAEINPGQISPRMQNLLNSSLAGNLDKNPAITGEFIDFLNDLFRDRERAGEADYVVVGEDFFSALRIPLLQGRLFEPRDTPDAPHVAVISKSLADQKWPGQNPLGRTIEFGNMDGDPRLFNIIGVVDDIRMQSIEADPHPTVYANFRQRPRGAAVFTLLVRTSGNPQPLIAAMRKTMSDLDAGIPPRFRTLSQIYSESLGTRRFSLSLVAIFSISALVLALLGVYGVTSFSVTSRVREIGIRMALGATGWKVLAMILAQAALTAAIGVAMGIFGSAALTRWLQSQLFGVSATDPLTFLAVATIMLLVSLLACYLPARRASRVDPLVALRYE